MTIIQFFAYYIAAIVMNLVMIIYYSKLTNKKIAINFRKIISILVLIMLGVLNNFYNLVVVRFLFSIILSLIINKICFNDNIKNLIFYTFIYTILSIIIELFLSVCLTNNTLNVDYFNNQTTIKVFFSFTETFILLIIVRLKFLIPFVEKIKKSINFYSFSISLIIFINILMVLRSYDMKNNLILSVSLISTIFICIFIKIIVNDKYNLKVLEEKNKNLKESYKAYSNTIEEYREFKHNVKNELFSLKSIIPIKYQESINKLINKYDNCEWINNIEKIPEGLQGLIYLKITEAQNKKVKIVLNASNNISSNHSDYLNISTIVGILIDNAIEASMKTKQKIIEINIKERSNGINIKILNKFKNSIDLNKIGKKNYSTKEYKSGLGLNSLNKLKNNNIKVTFNVINDIFIADIKYTYDL